MLKNFLETNQGKRIFVVSLILLVGITSALIVLLSSNTQDESTKESATESTVSSAEQQKIVRASIYQGKWYSDREDEMVIELLSDGTYRSSTWLSHGKYQANHAEQIVLIDNEIGEVTFDLKMKDGRTIMHSIHEDDEFFMYPEKDLMEVAIDERIQQEVVVKDLIYQKWLDILMQGVWENKSTNSQYSISFEKNKYKQVKKSLDKEAETFEVDFVIISQEVEEDSCLFVVNTLGDSSESIKFRVVESDLVYELNATPGTFLWQTSYEKLISEVDLTQDGTMKIEAEKITLDE